MNLDHDFFQVTKLSEDQKKRSSPNMEQVKTKKKKRSSPQMEHFFSPNSSRDLRSDAHQSQIIGGDADEDQTQIIVGIQPNYWEDIFSHPPQVSAPLSRTICNRPAAEYA